MMRRKTATHLLKLVIVRLYGLAVRMHVDVIRHAATFFQITWAAGCDDIVPAGFAAARSWDQMVKSEIIR